jgi:hypothetical protein
MQLIDEATASFLRYAAGDLQGQLGAAGEVMSIGLDESAEPVTLVVRVRVGPRELEFRGSGESLVTAYANIVAQPPEAVLAAAFRNVMTA